MSEYHPDTEQIVARLKAADVAYFTTGEVLMDDLAYDRDKGALRSMAPDHPYLKQVGSPVGHTPLQKVAHLIPMGSLDKAMNKEEYFKWVEKTAKALGIPTHELVLNATFKADGGSYSAEYKNGHLVRVLTRGDGFYGEDVTLNGRKFKGLPLKTNQPFDGLARFEGVLHVDDWATVDPEQLSNPRNAANGLGRRKRAEQAEYITAYGFRLHNIDGTPAGGSTEYDGHQALSALGFVHVPGCVHSDADRIWEWVEETAARRKLLPFWIDGIVVAVSDRGLQRELGKATDLPRWAVAAKEHLRHPIEAKGLARATSSRHSYFSFHTSNSVGNRERITHREAPVHSQITGSRPIRHKADYHDAVVDPICFANTLPRHRRVGPFAHPGPTAMQPLPIFLLVLLLGNGDLATQCVIRPEVQPITYPYLFRN